MLLESGHGLTAFICPWCLLIAAMKRHTCRHPRARCLPKLIERFDNQSNRRPRLVRFLVKLGLDHAIAVQDKDDWPWNTIGPASGLILRIAQIVAVDDFRSRIAEQRVFDSAIFDKAGITRRLFVRNRRD